VLFFSSRGQAYKEKVWRLPVAAPNGRGKALINMLPLQEGERITTIMPLPADESSWGDYDVMFATASGNVRRNKLSDFVQVNRAGKIAMKLDEGDHIVDVQICSERDDVLLTTRRGQCIRFPVPDVRVFKGRDSTGVRGIGLAKDDEVISLAILRHFEASPAERAAYLKQSGAIRRAATGEDLEPEEPTVEAADAEDAAADVSLSPERYTEMGAAEQFVLTASNRGYGKRSSSFEFRVSGRGGKGIRATDPTKLNEIGPLVAAFPVEVSDEIMLVSNGGQLIRVPVDGIRIVSRASKGVRVFNTSDGERVVSVEHIEGGEATEAVDENGDGPEEPGTGAPESGEGA
jgi:DNA gyrase subunit A